MRTSGWVLGLALGLCLAGPAWAQRGWWFWGGSVPEIRGEPISTEELAAPIATPQVVSSRGFRLQDLMPNFASRSLNAKPTPGYSQFPALGQQPGADYLKGFGFHRPSSVR